MSAKAKKQKLWQMRADAHRVHHKIADCVLAIRPDGPPKLVRLIEKYERMTAEADEFDALPQPPGAET